ncbi:TPA: septation initiation protein [Klebsiella pneumoniae]|uniref:Septation initiation protein n=1 Tax=Salmonella senftenberg TaxID=28150 RepID=A0A725ZTV5_SALSE|nr:MULTISPECIES: Sid [Enterobacteriaceae]EAB6380955.1 septation initiation protein [Salmonella enterica subsp. enterica serovar Emek]EBJ9963059.1 septation initiation protein [Salmonella enterica]ECD7396503.1 septation initiation protein [Salmonella enterica subsp. enterica serovar Westhampton]ECJ6241187.1 septation initiation protein [Salmonella enterica subsp. enterica]EFU8376024.1 septation initiation protein [Escherichia coli]
MNNTAENNNLSTFPAVTQQAMETLNTARSAWLEARRRQKAAADNIATIRQRRAEIEATTNALNDEWRTLFRESQGVISKEMKKLRTEIALGRETLEDFDELLAAQESENALLPQETAELAGKYIHAHEALVGIRAKQIWEDFMQSHGKALIQTLSLLKSTMGREASAVVGVVHSVNDPDTLLKDFIHKHITKPALANTAMPEQDPVFKLAGVAPDYSARLDLSKQLSPAAIHKMKVRQEQAEKVKSV